MEQNESNEQAVFFKHYVNNLKLKVSDLMIEIVNLETQVSVEKDKTEFLLQENLKAVEQINKLTEENASLKKKKKTKSE